MERINWSVAAALLPTANAIVWALEFVRIMGGFYSGLRWYAAMVKVALRVPIFTVAFAVFGGYIVQAGVADGIALAGSVTANPPESSTAIGWMLVGGMAVVVVTAAADLIFALLWGSAIRRLPWHWFGMLELWTVQQYRSAVRRIRRISWIARLSTTRRPSN